MPPPAAAGDAGPAIIPNAGGPFEAAKEVVNEAGKEDVISAGGNAAAESGSSPDEITDAASAMAHAAFSNSAAAGPAAGSFQIDPFGGLTSTIPPAASSDENSNSGGGGWFGKILGGNKNANSNEPKATAASGAGAGGARRQLPPPPPPPPPLPMMNKDHQQNKQQHHQGQQQHQQQSPGSWSPQPQQQQLQQQPMNQNYNAAYNNNQQQNYNDPNAAYYQNLLYELDESTLREMTLTHQIHNLTSLITTTQSEGDMLLSRIDVLTERLADSEANFHYVHNRNLELDGNCTTLTRVVESLKKDIGEYESRQKEFDSNKEENDKLVSELRSELSKVTLELEKLACLVETDRFDDEKTKYLDDFSEKQSKARKKKKKKVSFWAWVFGWDGGSDSNVSESKKVASKEQQTLEADERRRAAQELARTTLLHALQTERANVDELENVVMTLQRNNSAIMDVVSSRDSLVAELNDRVAVFEEDKMVLKAALRQLQMEIKEEAPKTQLLVEELQEAKDREVGLREDIAQLLVDFEEEREGYEGRLQEMNKTCEELELIGLYVDQLEDRLANYALAKKELQMSQSECERIRTEAAKSAGEVEEYKSQVAALEKEHDEKTKPLLGDLINERSQSRDQVTQMTNKVKQLEEQIEQWKGRVADAERMGEEIKSASARQLFLKVEEEKGVWTNRMEEEKQHWDAMKAEEMQAALERMKAEWESHSAQEQSAWKDDAETNFRTQLQSELAELSTRLNSEFQSKLETGQTELKQQYALDLQSKMDQELATLEEQKEQEMEAKLAEERASWEELRQKMQRDHEDMLAEVAETAAVAAAAAATKAATMANDVVDSMATDFTEDEVARAAERVYARLEESGVSFGIGSDGVDIPLPPFFSNDTFVVAGDEEDREVGDEGPNTDDDTEDDASTNKEDRVEEADDADETEEIENEEDTSAEKLTDATSSSSSTQPHILQNQIPPPQQQKQQQRPTGRPARNVPFRSLRKAFSHATGMHGLITPSTVQLHLRQRELLRKRHQQEKQKRDGKKKQRDESSDDKKDSVVDDDSSSASTAMDDSSTSTPSSEGSSMMQGDQAENGSSSPTLDGGTTPYQQPSQPASFSEQSTTMNGGDSWGSHFQGGADGFVASSSSWSSGSAETQNEFLEPPPLPGMDDR